MINWLVCKVCFNKYIPAATSRIDMCPNCDIYEPRITAKVAPFKPEPIHAAKVEPKIAVIADSAPVESIPEVGLWSIITRWWRQS